MNFEDLGGKTKIWASKGSFIILLILLTPNFIYFTHHLAKTPKIFFAQTYSVGKDGFQREGEIIFQENIHP